MSTRRFALLTVLALACTALLAADKASKPGKADKTDKTAAETGPMKSETFAGLAWRGIGPALMSGRVADIAVHPTERATWVIAVASGGLWRTENSGTTWTPVADDAGSYSWGCVTWDAKNPQTVWAGSGENNSQRSVGYGDGVYKSIDGGRTFKNAGLKDSEHIGKILVDPRDSNVVYVAAQGPLWKDGGDRGLYKTTDGGKTWKVVLTISDKTGVTDAVFDPRNPDVLYAAAYQRRRHVWTLINGGPEGAIYKSTDAGASWTKLEKGLPAGDVGRIGLAISPANPDLVYATIEAAGDDSGFYRSLDAGATWEKRSDTIAGGPQYYQEIFVDPEQRPAGLHGGRLHAGHRGRRQDLPPRRREGQARRQPRALDRPGRQRPPGQRLRRRRLRDAGTAPPAGSSRPTCRSRSSTSSGSTTTHRSTTSTAAPRTMRRRADRPAPRPRAGSPTRTGS